ncbi:hypothetical protein [Pseudacidovorax sp. RU35E]|uniref:hypothetical protein n=1 Tax=Pseudacidovorax sp. RU35E TaxID=1907403 RepID=UPI00117B0B63|nr:hypothetical protein [Pseudacidovorax sp. RU35E]
MPDEDALAKWIGWVAIGQALHVAEILHSVDPGSALPTNEAAKSEAVDLLTQKGADPWHRDGWMFQVMSWLAANVDRPGALIALPHLMHADKGLDGLEILLDESQNVVAAIIFEDKATENPRDTIRDDVWPELLKFELGHGVSRLTQQASGILAAAQVPNPSAAVSKISWNTTRRYRISITSSKSTPNSRKSLFKDFETTVQGGIDRRKAELFVVKDLRPWMANLAKKAIAQVAEL